MLQICWLTSGLATLEGFPSSANALLQSVYRHAWQALSTTLEQPPKSSMPDDVFQCTALLGLRRYAANALSITS